ncbi:MAG: endonuclease III domain-containing protein [Candidatus Omnitrophica bacterium]|nr:endonuclease III domain-containing protein [Candidatus Omnitrophota bacterium]
MALSKEKAINRIYDELLRKFGSQHWWPGDSPLEIIVGAVLTQNTNWQNVERAIVNLKKEKALSLKALKLINIKRLAGLIRSSGYYNIKAKRLKNLINFIFCEYSGSLKKMFDDSTEVLREKLLAVNGIGKETADSILLYGGGKPVFVVDAYTKRVFSRLGIVQKSSGYDEIQNIFYKNLKKDVRLYNEYHALIVSLGKNICKVKPACEICPLKGVTIGNCQLA